MQEQLMTNPDMMQNMMKQQLTGLVPQVGFVMLTVRSISSGCFDMLYLPAADSYGCICKLLFLWIYHGQSTLPSVTIIPTHAPGEALLQMSQLSCLVHSQLAKAMIAMSWVSCAARHRSSIPGCVILHQPFLLHAVVVWIAGSHEFNVQRGYH